MIRSKRLLDLARDERCENCGALDGTVVSAHYSGMRSQQLGKGIGHKVHDLASAPLCSKCHAAMDGYEWSQHENREMRRIDQSEQFLFLILKAIIRRVEAGSLTL